VLEVTVEHFDLDPARLWDALADLEGHREWMTDIRAFRFLTEQRSGLGTRYVIVVRTGPLRARDHIEVIGWDRPSELAITHRIGPARGEGRFRSGEIRCDGYRRRRSGAEGLSSRYANSRPHL
jgi:uncharacterized protein YndB with AHSA1/START domain